MIHPDVFKHRPNANFIPSLAATMVQRVPASKVLRMPPCTLPVLGGVCFGFGAPDLMHWNFDSRIALLYVAIFGSILITVLPVVRAILAIGANRSNFEMGRDAHRVEKTGTYHHLTLIWAAFGTDVKTWLEASR